MDSSPLATRLNGLGSILSRLWIAWAVCGVKSNLRKPFLYDRVAFLTSERYWRPGSRFRAPLLDPAAVGTGGLEDE